MVSSDTWTRVPRDDFVILKTFNFDHAQIFPLVSGLIVLVLLFSFLIVFLIIYLKA